MDYGNLQYHFGPIAFEYQENRIILSQGFSIHVDQLRPHSRGQVRLASRDPSDKPLTSLNFLSDTRDLNELVEGVEKCRALVAQSGFDGLRGTELIPGPHVQTRDEIAHWIRSELVTDFHPCGSCRMGYDTMAVVDQEMRVRGVEGLRVVDASVMPRVMSGNLNAPTQMIVARAADFISGRDQLPSERSLFAFDENRTFEGA